MTAAAWEPDQAELFPAADVVPLWTLVPNGQDACAPVELDELERVSSR